MAGSTSFDQLKFCKPDILTFGLFSSDEITKLSVVEVITPMTFNVLGHPLAGGLYDSAMGPYEKCASCSTCGSNAFRCPGHLGHIQLPLPVINPVFTKIINSILKMSCLSCFRILLPTEAKAILHGQMKLLACGCISEAREMSEMFVNLKMTWRASHNESASQLESIETVEKFVNNTLLKCGSQAVINNKGEANYRAEFFKTAMEHINKGMKCPFCTHRRKKVSFVKNQVIITKNMVEVAKKFSSKGSEPGNSEETDKTFLTPLECKKYFQKIWENDSKFLETFVPILALSDEAHPTDMFYMTAVPVTPTNTRPVNFVNGTVVEHPMNVVYKSILNDCLVLRSIIFMMNNNSDSFSSDRKEVVSKLRGESLPEKLQFAWNELQSNVDTLIDSDAKKIRTNGLGLKQIIEKKGGIIRMHMMGKRVNFAARSVITPDPNLNIDEIGIPEAFAKKLTYPVPVTTWNVTELRKMVINGPEIHPGANMVEHEDGSIVKLDPNDIVQRESVAKRLLTPGERKGLKIIHRHLLNGDILLLNRQPTLHRPSIMGHRARILKGEKTLRLHYANCKSYNADFDGDEMNAHFPQNEVARSEGYNLVSVSKQYLVPKDGTPLSGLIQDHVVSGVRLSIRGKFFTREEYMQLVFQGLSYLVGDIKILPPAILKPVQLWSGKQIISTIIINMIPRGRALINLTSTSKIGYKAWEKLDPAPWVAGGSPFKDPRTMTEAEVIIRSGELLCGVLDKMHYGSTPYSLVHCVYEVYGGDVSCSLLSSFAKLFTSFLQREGFTLGVSDILVVPEADMKRRELIRTLRTIGNSVALKAIDPSELASKGLTKALEESYKKIPMFRAVLDHEYKQALDSYTNNINKLCVPAGLITPFPVNNLQLMVQSGAKGSTVNTMQISSLLGQIELEGKRPPIMLSGKSLPSFRAYETSPRAGGFIDGRFMTGIKPQEFFFHCMAGREGLIDTAVKTSRSGYLQRCLVKHLESLSVNYDMTVRDSDGSVIQYCYGEDGLEVGKCQFLKDSQMPFLSDNIEAIFDKEANNSLEEFTDMKGVKAYKKKMNKWKKHHSSFKLPRGSGFTVFSQEKVKEVPASNKVNKSFGRLESSMDLCQRWYQLDDATKLKYKNKWQPAPDPIISKFQADRHLGAITEKLEEIINNYLKKNKGKVSKSELIKMVQQKSLLSTCSAGEPVGLLAAQSIGEPSTQMTLNTFHFAGRGEMNVTLGIPRLREILMVASKVIKTPTMIVPLKSDIPDLTKKAEKLRKYLKRVTLADVLEYILVTEKIVVSPQRKQVYILKMKFLPHEAYKDNTDIKPKQVLRHIEKKFLREFGGHVEKKTRRKNDDVITVEADIQQTLSFLNENDDGDEAKEKKPNLKKSLGVADDYQSSDEDEEDADDDATTMRRRERQREEQQYSDMEDELDEETRKEISNEEDEIEAEEEKKPIIEDDQVVNLEGRNENVVRTHEEVEKYRFDTQKYEWCEITLSYSMEKGRIDFATLLREAASRSVVREIPGIRQAFTNVTSDGSIMLKTEGLNFQELYKYSWLLNLNRLYSNNIHAVAETLGIEAASRVIVKEIKDVFEVYGIAVDPRHLTLVADYMTFDGTFKPFNRIGLEGGSSPLQQMSFEASLGFLRSAVIKAKSDSLSSASSRLMLGQHCKTGTGCFQLLHKITV